jgi:hypothetical protein
MVRVSQEELDGRPSLNGPRRRLLGAALGYYQKLIEQRGDNPAARADLETTRLKVQKILSDLAVLEGARPLYLLTDPDVLEDLRPTAEQRDGIAALSRRLDEQRFASFREVSRLNSEDRRQHFLEQARANEAEVEAVLTPKQLHRLRQIALQMEGPWAFQDPQVQKDLNLTPGQKDKIRAMDSLAPPGGPMGPGGPGQPRGPSFGHGPGPRKHYDQEFPSPVEKILEDLDPDQILRWKELTGEPFKGRRPPFFPPPHSHGPEDRQPDKP